MIARYGDVRGGHVDVYSRVSRNSAALFVFDAYYYGGADLGMLLGVYGIGNTPDEAVRDLWRKLHQ